MNDMVNGNLSKRINGDVSNPTPRMPPWNETFWVQEGLWMPLQVLHLQPERLLLDTLIDRAVDVITA